MTQFPNTAQTTPNGHTKGHVLEPESTHHRSLRDASAHVQPEISNYPPNHQDSYHDTSHAPISSAMANGNHEDLSQHNNSVTESGTETPDFSLSLQRAVTNGSKPSLPPRDTSTGSTLQGSSSEDPPKHVHPIFDSIAKTMRRLAARRKRVAYERICVEEQAKFWKIKRDEAADLTNDFKLELELNPPGSKEFDLKKTQELVISVDAAYIALRHAERKMDDLNKTLERQENLLRNAEERIYNLAIRKNPAEQLDMFTAVFDKSSTGSISPRTAQSLLVVSLEDLDFNRNKEGTGQGSSSLAARERMHISNDDYGHETRESKSTRHGLSAASPQSSPTLNLDSQEEGQHSSSRKHSVELPIQPSSDVDTSGIGDQFKSDQSEIDVVIYNSLGEMEADRHIRQRRKEDPVVTLTAHDGILDVESNTRPSGVRQSLGNRIGRWIVQLFSNSWLELSRFVPLVSANFPVIETLVTAIDYINLDILIRENWTFDDFDVESSQVRSIIPSVSSGTGDIPLYFRQQIISSERGYEQVRPFRVLRVQEERVESYQGATNRHSDQANPSSRAPSLSDEASQTSWRGSQPIAEAPIHGEDSAERDVEPEDHFYIEPEDRPEMEPYLTSLIDDLDLEKEHFEH